MKYGEFLEGLRGDYPEWTPYLPDYSALKRLVYAISATNATMTDGSPASSASSLEGKTVKWSDFFREIESEIEKNETHALGALKELRALVRDLMKSLEGKEPEALAEAEELVPRLSSRCSSLEKFVNVSYTTFYKILKKHDKLLPNVPCRQFYMARLNQRTWLRHLMETQEELKAIQAMAHGANVNALGGEVAYQSCRSYWVHDDDVSLVKAALLKYLVPVKAGPEPDVPLLPKRGATVSVVVGSESTTSEHLSLADDDDGDSLLQNVVYLDNYRLELYHHRLEHLAAKSTGSGHPFVIRLRWTGVESKAVTVERVTYASADAGQSGNVTARENFQLHRELVLPFLQGHMMPEDMRLLAELQGKPPLEVGAICGLFDGMTRQVDAKQLIPMTRAQFYRSSFVGKEEPKMQVQLDTSILMLKEAPLSMAKDGRWCRDPSADVSHSELHRFPHAVLSLVLPGGAPGDVLPDWVQDLESSGLIRRMDKFDKYLHGAAAVVPELAQSVPYWFGDASLQTSILSSSAHDGTVPAMAKVRVSAREMGAQSDANGMNGNDMNGHATHGAHTGPVRDISATNGEVSSEIKEDKSGPTVNGPLKDGSAAVTDARSSKSAALIRVATMAAVAVGQRRKYNRTRHGTGLVGLFTWLLGDRPEWPEEINTVNPKAFLANERTFLSWLHTGVTMGSVATAIIAFSSTKARDTTAVLFMQKLGLMLLPASMFVIVYGLWNFHARCFAISKLRGDNIVDRRGPFLVAVLMVLLLCAIASRAFARMEGMR
eukprot:jgi/Mesvir1/17538/Mv08790-RA.1